EAGALDVELELVAVEEREEARIVRTVAGVDLLALASFHHDVQVAVAEDPQEVAQNARQVGARQVQERGVAPDPVERSIRKVEPSQITLPKLDVRHAPPCLGKHPRREVDPD